jgi:DNA topoisomerase IB
VPSSTASGRLQSQHKYKQQQYVEHKKKQTKQGKINHFRLLRFKQEFLKITASLQTASAVATHQSQGQWLEEQVNMLKLRMFRVGNRRPAISRTEGQHLVPIKPFIKNRASK